jgi:hypothetical protein
VLAGCPPAALRHDGFVQVAVGSGLESQTCIFRIAGFRHASGAYRRRIQKLRESLLFGRFHLVDVSAQSLAMSSSTGLKPTAALDPARLDAGKGQSP